MALEDVPLAYGILLFILVALLVATLVLKVIIIKKSGGIFRFAHPEDVVDARNRLGVARGRASLYVKYIGLAISPVFLALGYSVLAYALSSIASVDDGSRRLLLAVGVIGSVIAIYLVYNLIVKMRWIAQQNTR